jgi:hypothetical protein
MPDRLAEALAELAAPADGLQPNWHDVARRARKARRRTAMVLAAAGAVVLASTALAVAPDAPQVEGGRVHAHGCDRVTGAPPAVRRAFAAHRWAGRPRAAASLATTRGRATLWVAPLRGRGWCEGLQLPRTRFTGPTIACRWWSGSNGPFGGGFVGPRAVRGPGRSDGRARAEAPLRRRELGARSDDRRFLPLPRGGEATDQVGAASAPAARARPRDRTPPPLEPLRRAARRR